VCAGERCVRADRVRRNGAVLSVDYRADDRPIRLQLAFGLRDSELHQPESMGGFWRDRSCDDDRDDTGRCGGVARFQALPRE
jgi:hypothetical protein